MKDAPSGPRHLNPAMQDALAYHKHSKMRRRPMPPFRSASGDEASNNAGIWWNGGTTGGAKLPWDPGAAAGAGNGTRAGPNAVPLPVQGRCSPGDAAGDGAFGYDSGGYPRLPSPYPLLRTLTHASARPAVVSTVAPFDDPELVELREQALKTLCTLLHQLGPAFVAYVPLVDRALHTLAVAAERQRAQQREAQLVSGDVSMGAQHGRRGGRIDGDKYLLKYRLLVSKLLTNQPMPPQDGPAANMMVGLVTAMGTPYTHPS